MGKPSTNWKPARVKIGPFDYTIRWYDRPEEDREARYGYTDHNELEIGVSDRLQKVRKADTFLHEVIHALWYILALDKEATEEEVATKYGVGLTMVFRDNPELFQWWLALCTDPDKKN